MDVELDLAINMLPEKRHMFMVATMVLRRGVQPYMSSK